jgi:glycosyltransferase involved in cell wall biosynthesis
MLLSNPFRPDPRVMKEAESLCQYGYRVTIICWDRKSEYAQHETLSSGIILERIQNVPSSYGVGVKQVGRLFNFWRNSWSRLKQINPDLIHCHDFDTLPIGLAWGRINHIPVIYDAHEYYADFVRPRLKGLSGALVYHTIKLSELVAARQSSAVITAHEVLEEHYRKLNPKVIVLGHYPTLYRFQKAAEVFTGAEVRLVYIGRISSDRGIRNYIDILRALRKIGVPARLLLAGVITPQSEEQEIQNLSLGLEDRIDFSGWIEYDRIPDYLNEADVGLVLLKPEPRYVAVLPVKLFEYMASGLPVIACNYPATASVVRQSECGVLIDPLADPVEIATIIQQWWKEPEIPKQLGANGRRAALEQYRWEVAALKMIDLYATLLDS